MAFSDQQKLIKDSMIQLPQPDHKVQCMHVWIDGTLRNFRSKDKTLLRKPKSIDDLPEMEFCGSATDFDVGNLADYYARPIKFYRDPFRGGDNTIAYCETYCREGLPTFANNRCRLLAARKKHPYNLKQFTFHQSYSLLTIDGHPITYLKPAYSPDSKSGFRGGKEVADAHYKACLYSGVNLYSYEPASNHGQWTYSIGTGDPTDVGDDSWISRFLLARVAEDFGVAVSLETSSCYSCLAPIYAGISLNTDTCERHENQRIFEDLLSQFVVKEGKPIKVTSLPEKIRISNVSADVDPYALLTKVIETVDHTLT